MQQLDIAEKITRVIEPMAKATGFELVHVVYRREALGWTLRVLLDREGGLTVDDCQHFSRELSDVLDVEDIIPNTYRLEVSSPGLDRPLVKPDDFTRFAGREVVVKTTRAIGGQRKFEGTLLGLQNGQVLLETAGQKHAIAMDMVDRANLVPMIDGFPSKMGKKN